MPRAHAIANRIVDVIAPGSPFDRAALDAGVALLKARGFQVRQRADIGDSDRFLAGTDQRRQDELQAAIDAPDSAVIWCVRGGYGCTRLVPNLSVRLVRQAAKILIGFSDVTALHARWLAAGIPSIHGSMMARIATEPADVVDRLLALLQPGAKAPPLAGQTLVAGTAEGMVAGGNLATLAAMCGTPYQPDLAGALVIVEDVNEPAFRIDRMMIQCEQAGLFSGVAGLAFGEFYKCGDAANTVESVISEHATKLGVPAISGLPFGHGPINQAVPLGVNGRIGHGRLEFTESLT